MLRYLYSLEYYIHFQASLYHKYNIYEYFLIDTPNQHSFYTLIQHNDSLYNE